VIRRRYAAGIRNFLRVYRPLTTTWALYDSSEPEARLIVRGEDTRTTFVSDPATWARIQREHADG
jgi:predicted ABC-type ATPase